MGKHSHLSLTSLAALGGGKIRADVRAELESQVFIRSKGGSDWRKPEGAITLVDKKTGKTVGQHFRTPDEAKRYAAKNKWQVVKEGTGHKLIIKSLHDAQATCSCGHWNFSATGARTKQDIAKEWKKHNKGVKEGLEEAKSKTPFKDDQARGLHKTPTYPVKLKAGMPEIKNGDKVTILIPAGMGRGGQEWKEATGKATMKSPKVGGWVLNMGGAHGTPKLASPKNIVAVNGKRVIKESLEEGKGNPRWEYQDSRGVSQTGTVIKTVDKGGTDVTYMFKRDKTGETDVVSGSRLKKAKRIWKEGQEEATDVSRMVSTRTGQGRRGIPEKGKAGEWLKGKFEKASTAVKVMGYTKAIVKRQPQTSAELEKLLRDVPEKYRDFARYEAKKRTKLSFNEGKVEGLVRRKSTYLQHCKACSVDIHPGSYFYEIGFHREYGVICNSCEMDGRSVVLEALQEIDEIMVAEASKSGMHELTRDGKSLHKGSYNDCLKKLQRVSPHSWEHSLKHEGYKIKPVKEGEEPGKKEKLGISGAKSPEDAKKILKKKGYDDKQIKKMIKAWTYKRVFDEGEGEELTEVKGPPFKDIKDSIKYYISKNPEYDPKSVEKAVRAALKEKGSTDAITVNHYISLPRFGGKGIGKPKKR